MGNGLASLAFLLAVIPLVLLILQRFRSRGASRSAPELWLYLAFLSMTIGTAPAALNLESQTVSIGASLISLTLSIAVVTLILRRSRT